MARDSDIPIFVLGIDVTESLPWLVESVKPVLVNVVRGRGATDVSAGNSLVVVIGAAAVDPVAVADLGWFLGLHGTPLWAGSTTRKVLMIG